MKLESKSEGSSLLGVNWNSSEDLIYSNSIKLNINASTKREVLASIASQYDIFNFHGPLLNRARAFMHRLQLRSNLEWDSKLSPELLREWSCIVHQANNSQSCKIERSVGSRNDEYDLVAFTDSSKLFFGCVLYLVNRNNKNVGFLLAKNSIINKNLSNKSIPSLELLAISFAVDRLLDTFQEFLILEILYF